MTERPILEPNAEHSITVKPTEGRVTVYVNGRQVAATSDALTLNETNYPPVQYIPMRDVDASLLEKSATTTYCPYKGDAEYFNVATDNGTVEDVIWTYSDPFPAVATIGQHVAFDTGRADVVVGS